MRPTRSELDSYWDRRKNLRYYQEVVRLAKKHAANAQSVIDVGSHISLVLDSLTWIPERTAIDKNVMPRAKGARNLREDFLSYEPPMAFDLSICLQVLEHVVDPTEFTRRLFKISEVTIVSVPYKWAPGTLDQHLHDPVDEEKLSSWAGRPWRDCSVVTDSGKKRLIVVFKK